MSIAAWVIIIAVVAAVGIYLGFRATQKKAHHLDDLHISPHSKGRGSEES